MDWLYIILIAYFILSISNLVDKIFLSNIVTDSIVYAAWVSFLSVGMISLFVIHWNLDTDAYASLKEVGGDLTLMDPWFIIVSIFVGVLFTLTIYLLYSALQKGEASRVIPLIGGTMPLLIYLLTFYYEPLGSRQMVAFIFLVIGTILISLAPQKASAKGRGHDILLSLGASFSFAVFFVLTQYIFRNHGFINGIVWPRLGTAFALILLFSFPSIRHKIRYSLNHLSLKMRAGWLTNQGLGALGFLGQQYVISLPAISVALVSALQSVQYVFILVFATLLSFFQPGLIKEYISAKVIIQKVAALISIGIGLYFIAV